MNGMKIKVITTTSTICKIAPAIEPVPNQPEIKIGVDQTTVAPIGRGTKPIAIAKYEIAVEAIGAKIHGIKITGFNTTGSP